MMWRKKNVDKYFTYEKMRKKGEEMKMDMEKAMVFARRILGKLNQELWNENKTTVAE